MRSVSLLLSLLVLGCSASDEPGALGDDADSGDSLPIVDGKADGYGVPASLGLDKDHIIYLTFDDGPSPAYTARVLDILAAHHAHATFFITGQSIAGNEALLVRERDAGHIVGNHQWQHVVATQSQFRGFVTREREALHGVVGDMPMFFRYPYGAMASWKETILHAEGYPDGGVGWDIDSLDWDFGPDERASRPEVPAAYRTDFEGYVLFRVEQRGGGVILMHDIQSITAKHLDSILTKLEARGYTFGELPRKRGFIGDACAADDDCPFAGGLCVGGLCTQPCTSTCPDRAGYPTTRCARVPDGDGASVDMCALDCATSACRAPGATCTAAASPSGAARHVCWGRP
jgi:peptidoglycan/xylan/chitin deacetylase (PgdA/CDA1 family)